MNEVFSLGEANRWQTDSSGALGQVTGWPFTHTYDSAGNLRNDGRHYFQYDGANRLKDVWVVDLTTSVPGRGSKIAHFDYDALGRHIKSRYNTNGNNSLDDEDTEWTPRDPLGRPIGIWRQAPVPVPSTGTEPCAKPYQLFGYHSTGFRGTGFDASGGILDCPAIRWRDTDGDGSLEETLDYLQDFRGDVTALVSPKFGILERVRYGPTGRPETFPAADVDFDGEVTKTDQDEFEKALSLFDKDPANYDPRADLNKDGAINGDDETAFFFSFDQFVGLGGNWKLSQGDGLIPGKDPVGLDNRFGWRGYWYDPHLQKYHVRNRVYDPREGRWMQNDPLGFAAGDQDLYRYCNGEYSTGYDPLGLDGDRSAQAWATAGTVGGYFLLGPFVGYLNHQTIDAPLSNPMSLAVDGSATAVAGYSDGLTMGIHGAIRQAAGIDDQVDHSSAVYKVGLVGGAIHLAALSGGASAEGSILLTGATGARAAIGSSVIGGMVGDIYFQQSLINNGQQQQYSPGQTLMMGGLSGVVAVVARAVIAVAAGESLVDAGRGACELEEGAARQIGQVAYGSTDLSRAAAAFRQATGITGARNVAIFEFRAADGSLELIAAVSERGVGHAERIGAQKLTEMGVDPSQVTRIFSELQPCNLPGGYCQMLINRTFPQAQVTWSFEYGATRASRAAGIEALKNAQGR